MSRQVTPLCHKPGGILLGWKAGESRTKPTRAGDGRRLALAIGVLLGVWLGMNVPAVFADGPIRVGLYVQFEDGSTFTRCVELEAAEATGLDVLRQSELDLIFETEGMLGTAICKIGETGCDYPGEDCFCQCLGTPCQYWTYWYAEDGRWKYSPLGASNRTVRDGGVEGWVWGSGRESPPVAVLAEDICPVPATETPIPLARSGEDSTPPVARLSATPTLTQPNPRLESGALSPSPQPPISTPQPAVPGSQLPSPFILLVTGLSGLGLVLLGVAYFVTRGRS